MPRRPIWQPDHTSANCNACRVTFTFDLRRHHCRHCGKIFCNSCSSKSRPLICLGHVEAVRICDLCERLCCSRDVFMEVVKKGDIDSVRAMLEQGLHPDSTMTMQTPIVVATSRGHKDILALLLEKGANVHGLHVDDSSDAQLRKRADTPLHYAAIIGSVECTNMLLLRGADSNWQSMRYGETPLHKSVVHGKAEIVRMLLESHADPAAVNDRGLSSLVLSALCGQDNVNQQFESRDYTVPSDVSIWDVLLGLHLYKRPKAARRSFCEHLLALHAQNNFQVEKYLSFICDIALHESDDDRCVQKTLLQMAATSPPFGIELSLYLKGVQEANPTVAARFTGALEDVLLTGQLVGQAAYLDSLSSVGSGPTPGDFTPFPTSVDGVIPATPTIAPHKVPIRAGIAAATASLERENRVSLSAGTTPISHSEENTPKTPLGSGTPVSLVTPTNLRSSLSEISNNFDDSSCLKDDQIVAERKSFLFRSRKFLKLCTELGTKLPLVPPAFRDRQLRTAVTHMNTRLPTGLYIPLYRTHFYQFAILRVPPEESFAFHTKTRAPYLLCTEIQVLNEKGEPAEENKSVGAYKTPTRGNTTMLRAIFGEPWSDKKDRIKKDSPHRDMPAWGLISFIVKSGDDLRQEQFAMQMIHEFQDIFEAANLPLWLQPYRVLVTGPDSGLIEAVPDAISLETLRVRTPELSSLFDYFNLCYGDEDSLPFRQARHAFVTSMAGYAVLCFLLQVKDRHDGNVLLDRVGHIMHIDFGFMLSNSPGGVNFEKAPFKLTQEFVQVMGGRKSECFSYFQELCVAGFLEARRQHKKILLLVEMFAAGLGHDLKLPCFAKGPGETLQQLRNNFQLKLTEEECTAYVHALIEQSYENWTTRQYDNYQRFSKSISDMFGW